MPTTAEKPRGQLFKDITDDVFNLSFQRLQEMRKNYPHYRDDELLMFMLCAHDSIVVVQAIRDAMETQRRCDAKIARTATYMVFVHPGTEPRTHPERRPIEHREEIALAIELGHSIE